MTNRSILQTFELGNTRGEQPQHENIVSTIIRIDTVVFAFSITRLNSACVLRVHFHCLRQIIVPMQFRPTATLAE